jgi:hypothetical protein
MDGMYLKQNIVVKPFMNFMEIKVAILQNTKKFYKKDIEGFWNVTIAPMQHNWRDGILNC